MVVGAGGASARAAMSALRTDGLDHVALAVRDLDGSERFYAGVLGLRRVYEHWDVPRFMLAGDAPGGSGVALFPVDAHAEPRGGEAAGPDVRVLHVAFRVDRAAFGAAQGSLAEAGIAFRFTDHGICHSIYFDDPDGHALELTTYEV